MRSTKDERSFVLKICLLSLLVLLVASLFRLFGSLAFKSDIVQDVYLGNEGVVTVILDAGHGGRDPGAQVDGACEKDLNLQIVKKIEGYLSLYDFNVVLTRKDDALLAEEDSVNKKREDLFNRVRIAKEYPDSVFVSIHMNKFPESKYNGLQVFYSPNARYSEALALTVQGNNKKLLESDNNRSIKRADSSIFILDRIMTPAILIECGFLSNDDDRSKLSDDEYQNKLAFVIANSIVEYYKL